MSKKGEENKEVELEEDTYVENTCINCFKTCLLLGQMKHSSQYLYTGEGDPHIYSQRISIKVPGQHHR